ncbi:MAG: hypothetical protein V4736_03910, partial [Bdellovibrionota bacterium]
MGLVNFDTSKISLLIKCSILLIALSSCSKGSSGGSSGSSSKVSSSGLQSISPGYAAPGTDFECTAFNPTSLRGYPDATIDWLAFRAPNGLTRHHQFTLARRMGYTGSFGQGEHEAWLNSTGRLA